MCDKIKATLQAVRDAFPFSRVDQRMAYQERAVPALTEVHDAVLQYQRPKDFFSSLYYLKLHDRADWRGSPPMLRLFTWRFMRALRARGLPFYVHTCYRTPELQTDLFNQGRSKLKIGPHQRACAVDIVSAIDHWEIPDPLWSYVGNLGEQIGRDTFLGPRIDGKGPLKIQWGGRWSFYDPAHWQLSDWPSRPSVTELEERKLVPYSLEMRFS